MGGKSTLTTRSKALDRVFSLWVRRSAADPQGRVKCVTCGFVDAWDSHLINAGHFWKRQHQSTRYDPHNVHVQCVRCNKYRGGAEADHAAYIFREYGVEVFQELEERHRQIKKWTLDEIASLSAYYKQKLTELERGV